ncbi:MAG: hypothetical protein JXA25_01115 [Anaerolineales bacterium]|nr:hypothetical protein [Anaerolineales bacterium]
MMTYKPIETLSENISTGNLCAICGHPSLQVIHVANFPDYIECSNCHSAFILAEDGEHVLYGKIHPDYSETREIALKQWIILAAVQQIAELERPTPAVEKTEEKEILTYEPARARQISEEQAEAAPPLREIVQPAAESPAEPFRKEEQPPAAGQSSPKRTKEPDAGKAGSGLGFSALWKEEPLPTPDLLLSNEGRTPEPRETGAVKTSAPVPPKPAQAFSEKPVSALRPEKAKSDLERAPVFIPHSMRVSQEGAQQDKPIQIPEKPEAPAEEIRNIEKLHSHEPEPGIRYRVVLSGSQIKFPYKVCSHCLASPASSSLSLTAFLPDAKDSSQRVPTPIRIPLCSQCRKRATAQSDAEKTQRSRGFLYSAGSSLLLILLLLISGIPAKIGNLFLGSFLIIITASIGFGIPLLILLERSNRFSPPADAFYVLSTLFLASSPPQDLTVFDWRNRGYAELFHLANRSSTVKTVHQVEDQGPILPPPPPENPVHTAQNEHRTPPIQDNAADSAPENAENQP